MIDPQLALAQAIAHARAQQQFIQPQPAMHPSQIHQIASTLASRIAGSRSPIGQANVGMFPQFAPPQQPQQGGSVGYAPNGNPEDYVPSGDPSANGDYNFFVRPQYSFARPNTVLTSGRMIPF